ncbi:7-carboxy-7-deazaguanine synthase [Cyanobium sp. N5-Cardenillas]|uniref:7-carboxy-7-deazaguanine synthase n=1 Tax=Cyanobium sp. N5-Cardenillas TaxID=2823720 RepID=UPI0039657C1D|nr:7-carboxy-7-deazaguanine synthase [Cyanobium sp. N5-Cardenillas]
MKYRVSEIFYSLQGEGAQSGRPAVFCRFVGCNLWSGREIDRISADCKFCDTKFVDVTTDGGDFLFSEELAEAILNHADTGTAKPYVVLTGGEPALQTDAALVHALHARGATVAIETNGTRPIPEGLDWVCVSPKAGSELAIQAGDELKVVFPQYGLDPCGLLGLKFSFRYIQPMDGPHIEENTKLAIDYCLRHPEWRLSLQTHKVLGVR